MLLLCSGLITLKGKGAIGKIGYVTEKKDSIFSRNIGLIRVNNTKINPIYIYLFLISKFGTKLIEKGETGGTGQSTLTTTYLKNIVIPITSDIFQSKIENIVELSHQKLEDSKKLYKQSENLLLKELDLLDFKPTKKAVSIKSFSESFGETGRLDAEYYQPKYDEVLEKIKKHSHKKLGNLVSILKSVETGTDFYEETGLEYVRVSNLSIFEISESELFINPNYFEPKPKETISKQEKIELLQPKKDTILLSKDGTVGLAFKVKKDEKFITSGAILHLNIKNTQVVLPDYLTLVLNSLVVQMQSERDAGGSIIKHWKPSEIEEVLIPIINNTIQIKIEEKIKESFKLKEESKQLLEIAKRAVEIAIEDGEGMAMEFINAEV